MTANGAETVERIKGMIYDTCLYQDDLEWTSWLDLCDDSYKYAIRAFSPEIQRDMEYLGASREHLKSLTDMLPKHNTDHSPLKRHGTVYRVEVDEDGKSASAVTSLVVYQTQLDGINSHVDAGESHIFLTGRYNDRFKIDGDEIKFVEREVRLDTRRLDKGSHWPI